MIALYHKELRALLPLFVLMVVIFGSDFFYRPVAERLDEVSWVEQSGQLEPGEGRDDYAIFVAVMALVLAYSAFPREHDERTIEFLYALPVSRPGIFAAKALAAWTVLTVGLAFDQLAGAFLQALNPQSWSGEQWRFGLALQVLGLDSFLAAVVLLYGLLISFLRRFGLVVLAFVLFFVYFVKRHFPSQAYLDPTEILALRYQGSELVLPWKGILFHGGVAVVAGLLAYMLWMGHAERMTLLYGRLRTRLAGRMALGCVSFAIVIAIFSWMMALAVEDAEETDEVSYPTLLPVVAGTEWYDFTYAPNQGAAARALIRRADRIYEEVAAAMGAVPQRRLDADLTDEGDSHAGIAQGGVIRVALKTLDAAGAEHALYHETVHAFQDELGGRRVTEHMNALRFFVEGSAEYIARELLGVDEPLASHRRLAVAAWQRHDIRFEELIDNAAFGAEHDSLLVYVLGETFAAALAEVCGGDAPARVFRAVGREDIPEDLAGLAFWQDTLRAADCALEPVVARWGEFMRELEERERAFLDALPRMGGGVAGDDEDVLVFRAGFDRDVEDVAEEYYLRVRRDPGVPEDQIRTFISKLSPGASGVEFEVPRGWVGGTSFEFQLGQALPGSMWPFFEDWQTVSLTD